MIHRYRKTGITKRTFKVVLFLVVASIVVVALYCFHWI